MKNIIKYYTRYCCLKMIKRKHHVITGCIKVVVTIPFCVNHLKGQMLFEMALEATIDQQNMAFNPAKLHSSIKIPFPKSSSIENEYFVYHQADLFSQSFSAIEGIRRMGKLCDVTLKVENMSFSAHRIVLAATVPYFNAMFTHDMIESTQKDIVMHGIDPEALEALINFAYSGRISINVNNVQSLLIGASFLQLKWVRNACATFIKERFHQNNVLKVRTLADSLGCFGLMTDSNRYIAQYFPDISLSEDFLNLNISEIIDIVNKDELQASEEQVFEATIRWVKQDELRQECFPQLLAAVRLPLLSPHYLADRVATEELIRSSHECRDLLDEAKDYHLMPERRLLLQSFRTRPRCVSYIRGHIYAVGGLTKSGDSLSTVEVYNPLTERWELAEAMSILRSRVGVAVLNNKLYAFGGYNGIERLSSVEVFDPATKSWNIVSPMHRKRSALGAAALNDRLYVCGGFDGVSSLNIVECYQPDLDRWTIITPMQKHRSAGGVVAFDGYIYILGGHDGLSIFDSVERYDTYTGQWLSVTPMLIKRCRLGVATLNGKLYACGGYDGSTFLQTVEEYDPQTDKWRFVASMNVTRSRVALVANAGKLWAIGGYDGFLNLPTVEVYDPKADCWTFAASMCAHEGGVGVGVIPIQEPEVP